VSAVLTYAHLIGRRVAL